MCSFPFALRKTTHNASQGMDVGSRWMGPDHSRTPSSFHEVADGDRDEAIFQHSEENKETDKHRSLRREDVAEVSHEAAQKRVAQFEGALKAFGDATGPEVTILQESLKSAKRAAQVHLSPCRSLSASSSSHGRRSGWSHTTRSEFCWSSSWRMVSNACTASESKFPCWQNQFTRRQIGEPRLRASNKW